MKKFIKVLLFAMLLFVTTSVKADKFSIGTRSGETYFEGFAQMNVKYVIGNGSYAFCLDSVKPYNDGLSYSNELPMTDLSSDKIRNVILKSYIAGLGTETNEYGISDTDLYLVTQMAVWHAAHGYDYKNGGYNEDYYGSWLDKNSLRRNAFNSLIGSEKENVSIKKIALNLNNAKMHLTDDSMYYVSDGIVVDGPNGSSYTVTASKGACILYNGKCLESQTVEFGKEFNLRVDNDGSNNISATANIQASKVLTSYGFNMLTPLDRNGNARINQDGSAIVFEDGSMADGQRIGALIPYYSSFSGEVSAEVNIEDDKKTTTNDEVKKVEVKICKSNECDVESDITVRELVTKDGSEFTYSKIDSWKVKSGESHTVNLKVDTFYRIEDSLVTSESVATYIKVTKAGEIELCKINGKDLSASECGNITNENFEIEGLKITINNCSDNETTEQKIVEPDNNSEDTVVEEIETTNIEAPNTGFNTVSYLIGSIIMLIGAGTVVIAKKKVNI